MDHMRLGRQYLPRGMALIQQLCEKEIINTMDQKKIERYTLREKKKKNLLRWQEEVIFLPSAVKVSSAISKTVPHFPTVASKVHENNSDPWSLGNGEALSTVSTDTCTMDYSRAGHPGG